MKKLLPMLLALCLLLTSVAASAELMMEVRPADPDDSGDAVVVANSNNLTTRIEVNLGNGYILTIGLPPSYDEEFESLPESTREALAASVHMMIRDFINDPPEELKPLADFIIEATQENDLVQQLNTGDISAAFSPEEFGAMTSRLFTENAPQIQLSETYSIVLNLPTDTTGAITPQAAVAQFLQNPPALLERVAETIAQREPELLTTPEPTQIPIPATEAPVATRRPNPTTAPTAAPTVPPTEAPTETPNPWWSTPEPTDTPTETPTQAPTQAPTPTPIPTPVPTPTPEPTLVWKASYAPFENTSWLSRAFGRDLGGTDADIIALFSSHELKYGSENIASHTNRWYIDTYALTSFEAQLSTVTNGTVTFGTGCDHTTPDCKYKELR